MPEASYSPAPLAPEGWTNADEVNAFLAGHPKGSRYMEGELFTLPDIEQTYTINAIRSFRRGQRTVIYLELRACCAVEGCGNDFIFTKALDELRKSPYLTRTCEEHRRSWSSPMPNAWMTSAECKVKELAAEARKQETIERAVKAIRYQPVQAAVIEAAQELALATDKILHRDLAKHAARKLPKPARGRDTREQQARRAALRLVEKGALICEGWWFDLTVLPA